MANIVSQNTSPTLNLKNIEDLGSTLVDRNFGRPEDYINIHIYDLNDNLLDTVENFKGYKSEQNTKGLIQDLNLDPLEILNELGYITGTYNIKVNIQKRKIFNTVTPAFKIKEISSTRTELKLTTVLSSNNTNLANNSRNFVQAVQNSTYFRDFILNFGRDRNITAVNIALDTSNPNDTTLQIKLLEPLLENLETGDKLSIVENIVDPVILTYDLGLLPSTDTTISIKGPNFKIDTRLNNSVPTAFRSYDDILSTSTTSSYQKLVSKLKGYDVPEIDYGYVRPTDTASLDFETVTPTHFENFVHFGSATELLKNFEYKLKLIEVYDKQIHELNLISGSSLNTVISDSSSSISLKKENLIQGFSGYEQYLYFESGAYSWPKTGSHPQEEPYIQSHTTSSEASAWLGNINNSITEGSGQLSSASIFDKQNPNRLMKLVPTFIGDREENQPFELFCDMIGEHFDPIWTHVKEITQTIDNSHKLGVSKNLVYYMLQNLGIEAYDQFENEDLINYIFGQSMITNDTSTIITGSNETFAKQDITKEIWKRLYHNAPYLLKTKGTERGLRALMSCYGVPSTVLNVKEYGGPVKDKTNYKTFSYDKSSLALFGSSSNNGYFLKTAWTSSLSNALESDAKTITFRIKPERSIKQYHLFSLSGSGKYAAGTRATFDTHLILDPYTGGDISSSGDSIKYGRIQAISGSSISPYYGVLAETSYFPIYNGDFWNVHIGREENNTIYGTANFGAYQSNHLKHISYHTSSFDTSFSTVKFSWGGKGTNGGDFGEAQAYFCGVEQNKSQYYNYVNTLGYTGSLQEVRYYFHSASTSDILKPKTLKIQALDPFIYAGNTTSSAYDELIFRAPLGSNLVCESDQSIDTSSFHPNIDVTYVPDNTIFSNMSGARYKEVLEVHHLPTPDTGIVMTSEKVRMDEGTIDDDILSVDRRSEISVLDRQPPDFEDLGVFFSPQTEINENIIYNMGAFRLDDFIGSPLPTAQTASLYTDLRHLRKDYFKRVPKRFNYWDYIKLINQLDHTLFKMIEQWVPMKANLKTGLLIEPHYLERTKFPRELPVIDDGQTMVEGSYNTVNFTIDPNKNFTLKGAVGGGNAFTTNNFKMQGVKTGSNHLRLEQGTNFTINVTDYILDEEQHGAQAPIKPYTGTKPDNYIAYESSTLLGNVMKGRASKKYYKFGQYINKLNA